MSDNSLGSPRFLRDLWFAACFLFREEAMGDVVQLLCVEAVR
jgi:hypothetical protein